MNNIPRPLLAILAILVIAVLALGVDRLTRISEADLLATVEQRIVIAGTDANVPATFEAQSTAFSAQGSELETQIAEGDTDTSIELETQIALAVTEENIETTVTAQGAQILTRVAELYPSNTPTATHTLTATNTPTATATPTASNTPTPTVSPTAFSVTLGESTIAMNVKSPAFDLSPDGLLVAYGTAKNLVVQDVMSQGIVKLYDVQSRIRSIKWSPNGQYIATGDLSGNLIVRDIHLDEVVSQAEHNVSVWSIAWSPDSNRIVYGMVNRVASWVVSENRASRDFDDDGILAVTWSPVNDMAIIGKETGIRHLGISSNLLVIPGPSTKLIQGLVLPTPSLAFSPDGSRLATITETGVITVFDTDTTQTITRIGPLDNGQLVNWSPDGRYIVTVVDTRIVVWNAQTGGEVFFTTIDTDNVHDIKWSPRGDTIYILENENIVTMSVPIDIEAELSDITPTPLPTLTSSPTVTPTVTPSPTLSPTATATASNTPLPSPTPTATDTATPRPTSTPRPTRTPAPPDVPEGDFTALSDNFVASYDFDIAPDGQRYAYIDIRNELQIASLDDGALLENLGDAGTFVYIMRWSPDGQFIAVNYEEEAVRIYEVATGDIVFEQAVDDTLYRIGWSPDGETIALGTSDTLTLWSLADGNQIAETALFTIGLDWSNAGDNVLVTGVFNPVVFGLDGDSFERLEEYSNMDNFIYNVKYSPDNSQIVGVDVEGGVAVWSVDDTQPIWSEAYELENLRDVRWSPDGRLLAVISNTEILVLDAMTGDILQRAGNESTMFTGRWSPTGKALLILDDVIQIIALSADALSG